MPKTPPLLAFAALMALAPAGRAADALFTERVAPLLRERCLSCHNPAKRRGGLDLSTRAAMLKGGDGGAVVAPGSAAKSRLLDMVGGDKPKMPKQGGPLSAGQVGDLRRWIDDGAAWPDGVTLAAPLWWSLAPLDKPSPPAVKDRGWVRTPVDSFVLAALEARGLKPAPEADRVTLIRRLTFDLHGLPPTPAEIDAFVNDKSADAYEKLVDRLFASPRYGERWGRHWLDVVHYGDTHGYDKDHRRDHAWPYRDYVIKAFNDDKPYSRFVKEQLAGDVLYPADPAAVVATGFITAGPWDFVGHVELREGTVEKQKTRLLDRDDMVANAISTFVSMTAHCARCHDHKFDPIPQKDYYRLQAVFAGVERGDRPYPNPASRERRAELAKRRQKAEAERKQLAAKIDALTSPALERLDKEARECKARLAALPALPPTAPSSTNGYHSGIERTPDVTKWVQADLGKSLPLDAVRLLPARPVDFPDTPGFGFPPRFRVEVSDDASFTRAETIADHTRADFPNPGDNPVSINAGGKTARYVRVTATRLWKRTNDYAFALAEMQVESGGKNVALGTKVTALDSIEQGRWSRKHLVDDCDSRKRLPDLSDPKTAERYRERRQLEDKLHRAATARQAEAERLIDAALRKALAKADAELAAVAAELKKLNEADQVYGPVTHAPRPIHVLRRGDVQQPKEEVGPGALSALPDLDAVFRVEAAKEGARRAALAEWVVHPKNVLTWGSIVNRVWQYHFGRGLVDTPNDFGANGSKPTHPELLDWLAVEFRDGGQSFKKLHRLLVCSAAYRQSSRHDAAAAKVDADNRYLWRMNRQRLDAESVRDAVLAVSGKLDLTMGGPGFGLFRYRHDHSPDYDHTAPEKVHDPKTYRRTVYRFVVRSVPNPFLESLDCADPNINVPVRNTTLTALQALALLNDPFMVRQAEHFAERLKAKVDTLPKQVDLAYRLAFGRLPSDAERHAVVKYAKKHGLANACRVLFNANEFVFVD